MTPQPLSLPCVARGTAVLAALLLALVTARLPAEVHSKSEEVPPSFTANYGTIAPGDVLNLTVTHEHGIKTGRVTETTEGPSAWTGGVDRECGVAQFSAAIPADFSGRHEGSFGGELCVGGGGGTGEGDGDGDDDSEPPPPPTWSGEALATVTCDLDRVELTGNPTGGADVLHGDQGEYVVTAYDSEGNNINDKVSFTWKKIEFPLGQIGVVETDLGSGESKAIDFRVFDAGTISNTHDCSSSSSVLFIVFVEGRCGNVTKGSAIGINVGKGTLVASRLFDEIISDTTGAFQDVDIGTPVVVPKTPAVGTVTKTLKGTFSLEGSVTVSGSAEAKVAPFGVGTKVTVGVSGTTTVSQTDSESVSVTVETMEACDIRIRIVRRVAIRETIWQSITEKEYDTGYDERCVTGGGNGQGQEAEIRTPITLENCD